jgi:DNA polymerase sigma
MEQIILDQLKARNNTLIDTIIQKAQRVCPQSIALIGITGSFYTGDIHPKSDLDLCIVINDPDGWKMI